MDSRNSIEQTLAIHRELMLATDKLLSLSDELIDFEAEYERVKRIEISGKLIAMTDDEWDEFVASELEDYHDSILDDEREGR